MIKASPKNPFKPGIGDAPPVMGHRLEVVLPLLNMLGQLQDGEIGSKYACLYGPRGNGKTVLLRWLGREA